MGVARRSGELLSMSEFPSSIGKVANRELALHGYTTFDSLTKVSAKELLKIHGIGPKSIRILGEELALRVPLDLGVRNAFRATYGEKADLGTAAEAWRPHRTFRKAARLAVPNPESADRRAEIRTPAPI